MLTALSAKQSNRKALLNRLKNDLRPLEQFDTTMQTTTGHVGVPLRQLLCRCVELRDQLPGLSALEKERLPDYASWWHNRERIASLSAIVQDIRRDGILAKHPLSRLSPHVAQVERPLELIAGACEAAERHFQSVEQTLGRCGITRDQWQTLPLARMLVDYAKQVLPLTRLGKLGLVDPAGQKAAQFSEVQRQFQRQQEAVAEAQRATGAWRQKLPATELPVALEQATLFERSVFAWLMPGWWRLRRILNQSYDFRSHVVKPRWTQVLSALQQEYVQLAELERLRRTIAERFGLAGDIDELFRGIHELRQMLPTLPAWLGRIHAALLKSDKAPQIVARVIGAEQPLRLLGDELSKILCPHIETPLDEVRVGLKEVKAALGDLPAFLQCLAEVATLPDSLATVLCTLPLAPSQIEAAAADHSLATAYRELASLPVSPARSATGM